MIKESRLGVTENENEKKSESTSLSFKHPTPHQQLEPIRSSNHRSIGVPADSSTTHPPVAKTTGSTHSKRSGTKGEVGF